MTLRLLTLSLSIALGGACLQAHAIGTLADVTVVDRDSGATLPVHYARGEYWVAGRPGARYAVAVRSKTGERLLAVTAVDGVNVLSGDTAAWSQTGYVFSSYERYQITGWRKSSSEVAAFEFSDARDAYAGVTGRPGNVGVIGVALFRERLPEPVPQPYPSVQPPIQPPVQPRRYEPGMDQESRLRSAPAPAPAAAAAPPAMVAHSPSALADRRESAAAEQSAGSSNLAKAAPSFAPPMPSPKLGTAHGQRETSVISHTRFDRLQSQPNEVIRIRYDSRENLIASGVIREPVARHPVPNPFPESGNASYVPDPPVRRY